MLAWLREQLGVRDPDPCVVDLQRIAFVDAGRMVVRVQADSARELVRVAGRRCRLFGRYEACVVSCSILPVMPALQAAVALPGVDFGFSVRYNCATNQTLVTAFTNRPDEVDLRFVERAPFFGGGRRECKGATLAGFFDLPAWIAAAAAAPQPAVPPPSL
jgi:hypothetical protein